MPRAPESPAADSDGPSSARTYAGRGPAERSAQRCRRFIEAGIALFGTLGYHATTVRALTAEAGLTNRYFYESFVSTEDLLMACYSQVMADYRRRLERVLAEAPADLEGWVRAGIRCFFDEMRDPGFARLTQVEVLGVSPNVDALYVRTIREFGALLMGHMQSFEPQLASSDSRELEVVGIALTGAISHAGAMWMRSHYRDSIDTLTDALVAVLLGTMRQLTLR